MAITQAVCNNYKVELMQALHNFTTGTGHVFKFALYTSAATIGAATATYTPAGEVVGAGYTAGGNILTNVTPVLAGTTGITDFADTTWTSSTITARGAMIYNSTNGDRGVGVLDFGSDKSSSAGDFTIIFPTADANSAVIRIA
jgi:hypothetical protein